MRGPVEHGECGSLVVLAGDQVLDLDGGAHLCRDYVAWHLPVDGRHPSDLDVIDGRRPVVERYVQAA